MRIKLKPLIALVICLALFIPMLGGCTGEESSGEFRVIRIGTHAQVEDDPYLINETTNEVDMHAIKQKAAITALEKVKEKLNVEIQFLQYSSDLQQLLLQTVLAGDPYCELAIMWGGCQGTILSQNVLQPLDKYAYIFHDDPDGQWILPQKTFGHYFLMNRDLLFSNTWPIVYNATMLEKIPALKEEDGTTRYPSEMYFDGTWTWSEFEKYMRIVKEYYNGKTTSTGAEIVPFNTNFTFFGQFALHSVGAGVYDGAGMAFATAEGVQACEFVERLFKAELVSCSSAKQGEKADSGWLTGSDAFLRGETVFTNCARWRTDDASMELSNRGESMGVIPFPYPDGTNPHTDKESKYRHLTPMADSVGLLRGVDEKTSKIALEAYKMYKVEFYKAIAGVDSIEEYIKVQASSEAVTFGIDIFHPEIGEDNLKIWAEFGDEKANEYSESCGIMWTWSDILGKSIYGVDGFSNYRTSVEANKGEVNKKLETINSAVNSSAAVDTVRPQISLKQRIALPVGTNPKEVDWSAYFSATDNIDGDYPIGKIHLDCKHTNFNKVGVYNEAYEFLKDENDADVIDKKTGRRVIKKNGNRIIAYVTDSGGQTTEMECDVYIYDPENTDAPIVELKGEGETLSVDEGTFVETVKWNEYIKSATDADGLDLKFEAAVGKNNTFKVALMNQEEEENPAKGYKPGVQANTSWLDVTVPTEGEGIGYPVELTITDYAGNSVTETIYVKVNKKSK